MPHNATQEADFSETGPKTVLAGLMEQDTDLLVIDFWPDGAVNEEYYQCWKPNSLIMGPYGSGKSKTTAAKLFDAICMMPPNKQGVRQSSTIVTRNYESDLLNATLEDWLFILPDGGEGMGTLKKSKSIVHELRFTGPDGIDVEADVHFIALNNFKEAQKKMKGKEYTYAWFNECSEQPSDVVNAIRARVGGRFPAHNNMPNIPINDEGDRYWSGAFYDTNPPDDESWIYEILESPTPSQKENWGRFKQPAGAIKNPQSGEWEPNPLAENLKNLSPSYYRQKIADAISLDFVRINYGNEYGTTLKGVPVYSNYSPEAHETELMDYRPELPVVAGMDYGRTPAMGFWQKQGDVYLKFDEFCSNNMSAELFAPACKQFLWDTWKIRAADIEVFDDPSGGAGGQGREDSPRKVMRECGFKNIIASPCEANDITIRRNAMIEPLGRMSITGKACIQIHKRCKVSRKGCSGKFYYRKLDVTYDDMYTDKPVKNWYSHICEADEYALVGFGEGLTYAENKVKKKKPRQNMLR